MKKLFIVFFIIVCNCGLKAQQKPQYTQYIFNHYLLNPALSGIENYTDVRIGYRQQWTGITNAPKTAFATINFKLGDDYLWRQPLSLGGDEDDPMSKNYMQNYTSAPPHHGVGLTLVSDRTGPISRIDANLTYAYHLQLNDQFNLSTGIALGVSRINLDLDKITLEDSYDPALSRAVIRQYKPDLNIGIWLYGANLYAGAAIQQILPQKLRFSTNTTYDQGKENSHIFFTAGYRFFMAEDISAIPSILAKYVKNTPMAYDFNMKMAFKDKFWLGGSWRRKDSFSALLGANVSNLVNLTYAYDFTTSALNQVSSGSHEIVLGFQLSNIYKVPSRIPIW